MAFGDLTPSPLSMNGEGGGVWIVGREVFDGRNCGRLDGGERSLTAATAGVWIVGAMTLISPFGE